uniref:Tyrosine specific protein phosphatases domain-containing protein n=1 Tax=Amphimedon queenslandica TaxID=400682 RepID=A0A1X7T6M8_AMPQE
SRSGVYCSVSIALEQCKAEGVVDVFQVTKAIRRSKPGAVTRLEQYTSIYDKCIPACIFSLIKDMTLPMHFALFGYTD